MWLQDRPSGRVRAEETYVHRLRSGLRRHGRHRGDGAQCAAQGADDRRAPAGRVAPLSCPTRLDERGTRHVRATGKCPSGLGRHESAARSGTPSCGRGAATLLACGPLGRADILTPDSTKNGPFMPTKPANTAVAAERPKGPCHNRLQTKAVTAPRYLTCIMRRGTEMTGQDGTLDRPSGNALATA